MGSRALAFANHGANDSQRYRHQRRYPSLPHHGKRRPALSRRVQSRVNAAGTAKAYSGALSPPQQTERPSPAGTLTQPLSSHSHSPFRGNPNESNSLVHSPLRVHLGKSNQSPCSSGKPPERCGRHSPQANLACNSSVNRGIIQIVRPVILGAHRLSRTDPY